MNDLFTGETSMQENVQKIVKEALKRVKEGADRKAVLKEAKKQLLRIQDKAFASTKGHPPMLAFEAVKILGKKLSVEKERL